MARRRRKKTGRVAGQPGLLRRAVAALVQVVVRLRPAGPFLGLAAAYGGLCWAADHFAGRQEESLIRQVVVCADGKPLDAARQRLGTTGTAAIEHAAAASLGRPLLWRRTLMELRDRLAGSPFVRSVSAIRTWFPGRVEIELELREPWACVVAAGDRYLVGTDSMVLAAGVEDSRLVVVEVAGSPRVTVGRRWPDETVARAVALCRPLEARLTAGGFPGPRITRISIGPDGSQAVFHTSAEMKILWGSLGEGTIGEPDAKSKLRLLTRRLQQLQNLDDVEYLRLEDFGGHFRLRKRN